MTRTVTRPTDRPPPFLYPDVPPTPPEQAGFHIVPCPLERSVSYGPGTANGPMSILTASSQLETFDGISVPAETGLFTTDAIDCSGDVEAVLERLADATRRAHTLGAVPITLGGEHTLTLGAVNGLRTDAPIGVVQFDAHADLRDRYEGSPLSHACVMRRLLDLGMPIVQFAVRSLSVEEVALRKRLAIPHTDASTLAREPHPSPLLPDGFPECVYVTFDVDALDPSILPATGTPEPGGLGWYDAMSLLERVTRERRVIGADIVEFAPIEGHHAYDFTVARLAYNLMGFIARSQAGG